MITVKTTDKANGGENTINLIGNDFRRIAKNIGCQPQEVIDALLEGKTVQTPFCIYKKAD